MTSINVKHFDVFNFVKKAKEFGVNEQFAEYEARQIEQAINTLSHEINANIKQELHPDELITKNELKQQLEIVKLELQKEIANIETRLIKWLFAMGISSIIILCGATFTMLKLMIH